MWLALAALAVSIVVASTPAARGAISTRLKLGGIWFSPRANVGAQLVPTADTGRKVLTLSEARAEFGFDLPKDAPAGFVLDEGNVIVTDMSIPGFSTGEVLVELLWRGPEGRAIRLGVQRTDPTVAYDDVVAPGSARETTINGLPVAVVDGAWDADTGDWSPGAPITLSWRQGADIYDLGGDDIAELLAMAATMPHYQ
jgi:hypothetical protein